MAEVYSEKVSSSEENASPSGGIVEPGELSHHAEREVIELARTMTQQSLKGGAGDEVVDNPFEGSNDPQLDPASGHFNLEMWLKRVRLPTGSYVLQ